MIWSFKPIFTSGTCLLNLEVTCCLLGHFVDQVKVIQSEPDRPYRTRKRPLQKGTKNYNYEIMKYCSRDEYASRYRLHLDFKVSTANYPSFKPLLCIARRNILKLSTLPALSIYRLLSATIISLIQPKYCHGHVWKKPYYLHWGKPQI